VRILIVTDSWPPVVSGVVRTLQSTIAHLERFGHQVKVISPDMFRTVRLPTDTVFRLAVLPGRKLAPMIEQFDPDAIHIACEGPLGISARRWCLKHGAPFTTSYTTKIPEYFKARVFLPERCMYPLVRWFHNPSSGVMVATDRLKDELARMGVRNLVRWSRGVDTELFRPRSKDFITAPRPIMMHVGRVFTEKNITAFLDLDLPGTKYVVGDGAQRPELERKYPHVRFTGNVHGEELARYYAAADVFVFPSRTDTFGLVMLESLASGVPVAAYPVPGPLDVIGDSDVGVLDEDLGRAVRQALSIPPERCRAFAEQFGWESVARQFERNLRPIRPQSLAGPHFQQAPVRKAG
jgi:glycosyltransferase involved in cell wall biosynthesis